MADTAKLIKDSFDRAVRHVDAGIRTVDHQYVAIIDQPDTSKTCNTLIRAFTQTVVQFLSPVVPFATQAILSAGAFTAGLGLTQLSGFALRVSCASPYASSALGMLGVGLGSALAGIASQSCRMGFEAPRRRTPLRIDLHDVMRDMLIGIIIFKASGGRFRSILPSDLRYVGACARESLPIPVRSNLEAMRGTYSTSVQKSELLRMFRRDGCHHCGKRTGSVIGDHQPPNKVTVKELGTQLLTAAEVLAESNVLTRAAREVFKASGLSTAQAPRVVQRFYPQCSACSTLQATAVRVDKQVLVRSRYVADWAVVGALVGLQYCYDGRQWQRR